MTTWRLLIDDAADGATNMARDEALLIAHAAGRTPSTLRLYRWQPACVSLGRFQRSADVDCAACVARGLDIVRRPSGGRALLHADELTYAVVARADHPLFAASASILSSYAQISQALLRGLHALGVPAAFVPAARRRDVPAACFATPASYEITVAGRKLVGSAQARRDAALLQHGALPFSPHADQLQALLTTPTGDLRHKMITLDEALGRPASFDEVAAALAAGFAAAWGVELVPGALTADEQALADALRAARYASVDWTFVR